MGTHPVDAHPCGHPNPWGALIPRDAHPHGHPDPWALTPTDTQTHEHPTPLTPAPMDAHPWGQPNPRAPTLTDTQPHGHPTLQMLTPTGTQTLHPPLQEPASAAPSPWANQQLLTRCTHPHRHPPSWTPTSLSTHLTNTQCHGHTPHRPLSLANTHSSRYPHRLASSPCARGEAPTTVHPRQHPPTHSGLLILRLVVPCSLLQRKPGADTPGLAQALPPRTGRTAPALVFTKLTLWNKVGGKIVYYRKQF